ncbi:MAG: sialidase family protein, partial [Anaerolineae bacterium]
GMIAETDDGGISWNVRSNTGHPANHISAISVHPADRDLIFIGGGDHWEAPGNGDGWLARSPDRGDSWQDLDVGQTISNVTSIVFDPVTTDTVYIGTCTIHPYWDRGGGSGVFKSTDGGDGWSPANTGLTYRCVRDLVIRPDRPQVLLAAINDPSPGAVGVFKSVDGGETWHASDAGLESSQVLGLTLDPLQPSHIYAATWGGLFLSTDGGATWQRAQGSLGLVPVFSVSASAYEERTRVYVGVLGGAGATMANRQVLASNVAAGVYQMTVVHRQLDHSIYLPLVTRSG